MPTYVCTRCGRKVVKPAGEYYCKVCHETMVPEEWAFLFKKKPIPKWGRVVGKVYLVESWIIPGTEFNERIGVFASYKSAKRAADEWWEKNKDLDEPIIEEVEVID